MGFKTVYQCLVDVFPQIDTRLLRAVAIEHPKDVDTAVEVVLSEILPFTGTNFVTSSPPSVISSPSDLLDGGADEEETLALRHRRLRHRRSGLARVPEYSSESRVVIGEHSNSFGTSIASSSELRSSPREAVTFAGETDELSSEQNPAVRDYIRNTDLIGSISSVLTDQEMTALLHADVEKDTLHGNTDGEELILLGRPQTEETVSQQLSNQDFDLLSTAPVQGVDVGSAEASDNPVIELPLGCESNIKTGNEHGCERASCSLVQENDGSDVCFSDHKNEGPDDSNVILSEAITSFSEDRLNDCKTLSSTNDDKISLHEKMVEDAKSNKKILLAAMESFMNMMKEVELKEKAVELAQEEAAKGGLDILVQVEELKKMIEHAKQANDMHAGEVYGEKAILATESRELQARLCSLSDDRDGALAILDEMHQTLQYRLAAAEDMRKAAEQERLEKEEFARSALSELEVIMDKVAQESKMLQVEAEENSKLREFLMDRGRMVDTLQGEISVICLDVKFLKGRFDEGIPLSKSISSSQTSCALASSGSSLRSPPPDLALDLSEKSKSSKLSSSASSVASIDKDVELPKSVVDEERIINCYTNPLEDDWEIFEAAEFPREDSETANLPR